MNKMKKGLKKRIRF